MTPAMLEAENARLTRQRDYLAGMVEELEDENARLKSRATWLGRALSMKSLTVDVDEFSLLVQPEREVYL